MKLNLRIAAVAVLAASFAVGYAEPAPNAAQTTATHKKPMKKKAAREEKPAKPTVEEQLEKVKSELQGEINGLKQQLNERDEEVRKAQQAASEAQATAAGAQQAAASQTQALSDNATAVTALQATVADVKTNQASLVTTVTDETAKVKKAIESPDVLHYKGVAITPGGFAAGETVYRTAAIGGDIPTAFSSIPYGNADASSLSEFYGTGRQSRLSLLAEGKTGFGTIRGYWEADFLGTGITSNNNQSNSYVMRQRVVWAQAAFKSGLSITAGQQWSLLTEGKKGITSFSGDVATPQTIDPNYVPGFVWTRQYGFRVVQSFKHFAVGISAENPQVLYSASLAGNTPWAVLGAQGTNGGNYNAGVSSCSPSTSIVNYTNISTGGINTYIPVYKTVNSCSNLANISFNQAPDLLGKIAIDPGWGHYELFGIARFAHEEVYPGETTNSTLYGGLTDILTGATVAPALTTAGAFSNSILMGGGGGSLRVPVIAKKLDFGAKVLYGYGVGRYGDTTLSDVTTNSWGGLSAMENVSGLLSLEANVTPRLAVYVNYGGDYAGRVLATGTTLGAPKAAQNPTSLKWGGTWAAPSTVGVGYGSTLTSNSGCASTTAPAYNGTGFYPGTSCGDSTRDVQEYTAGYWYDFYKGPHGRLRQGLQYGYAVRQGWSGVGGIEATGGDNMFWTSFRYYLP